MYDPQTARWLTPDPLAQKEIILYFMLIQMEGLDVASALIPGVTAPMTKVAVKRKVDRTLVNNRKHKQIIELYD